MRNCMDISRLVSSKPSHSRDALIARAARSWDPEFPGRMEVSRRHAAICRTTMILAASRQRSPQELLSEVCRIKCVDESEVIEALEAIALRINEEDRALKENLGMGARLASKMKCFLERLR